MIPFYSIFELHTSSELYLLSTMLQFFLFGLFWEPGQNLGKPLTRYTFGVWIVLWSALSDLSNGYYSNCVKLVTGYCFKAALRKLVVIIIMGSFLIVQSVIILLNFESVALFIVKWLCSHSFYSLIISGLALACSRIPGLRQNIFPVDSLVAASRFLALPLLSNI